MSDDEYDASKGRGGGGRGRGTATTSAASVSGRGNAAKATTGRGRATPVEEEPAAEEEESPRVVSGRGRAVIASPPPPAATVRAVAVAGRGRAAAPPPAAAATTSAANGRGRGSAAVATASDDEADDRAELVSSAPKPAVTAAGRGRGSTDVVPAATASSASASGRGRGVSPTPARLATTTTATASLSDDDEPEPEPAPKATSAVAAGRGRGVSPTPVRAAAPAATASLSDDEDANPKSAAAAAAGRGRSTATVSSTTAKAVEPTRSATISAAAGRGRGNAAVAEQEDDTPSASSSSGRPSSVVVASGRGRAVSPSPARVSEKPTGNATKDPSDSDDESDAASNATTTVASRGRGLTTSSTTKKVDDEQAAAAVNARGRGATVLTSTAADAGRGRATPVVKKDPEPEPTPAPSAVVAVGRGRGKSEPTAAGTTTSSSSLSTEDSAGRGRGRTPAATANGSSRTVSSSSLSRADEDKLLNSDGDDDDDDKDERRKKAAPTKVTAMAAPVKRATEQEEKVLTAAQKRRMEQWIKEKEERIRTMDDLLKELQPNEEEVSQAMELASYLDRELAAEEEEAAPVVQPKSVPYVTKTLVSESTVKDAGVPTCLAVRKPFIAIGMSRGVVLVFDKEQKLAGIIGAQDDLGSVSAMALSNSTKMLLVGHERGTMVLYDLADMRKPVKTLTDTHTGAVVFVDFLKDDYSWVSADANGKAVVSALTFMVFGFYHSVAEIVPASDAVLCLRVMRPGSQKDNADGFGLGAICTAKGGLSIFSAYPKLKVWKNVPRPEQVPASCVPYLSWREAVSTAQVPEPILAFGWGNEVTLFRVAPTPVGDSVVVTELGRFSITSEIVALTWLGNNAITAVTAANEMKVLDPTSLTVLETTSMENMEMAAHRFLGPQYPLGCFCNSVTNQGDSGFMLGVRDLYALRVWSWKDRIKALIDGKKFLLALATCLETYQLKGKGYLGVAADPDKVRQVASKKIEEILSSMLVDTLGSDSSTVHDRRVLASVCVRYCQAIGREKNLFDVIFPMFQSKGRENEGIFLELLEPQIVQDRLKYINGQTLEAMVDHYGRNGWLRRVEKCLLHLDVKAMEFDKLVTVCKDYGLASAYIYIYTTGLRDYVTPLNYLFQSIKKSTRSYGLRLVLYITKCLSGQAFPTGLIPLELQDAVKAEVVEYLLADPEKLKTLIMFDAKETFRALTMVMEDSGLADKQAVLVEKLEKLLIDPKVRPFKPFREQKTSLPFTCAALSQFFIFMARAFSAGTIALAQPVFDRVLGHLALDDDPDTRAERQQALVQMVKTSATDRYDEKELLLLAQGAEMFELVELFYMRKRKFRDVVQYAMENAKYDKKHVFDLIGSLMRDQLSDQERQTIRNYTMANVGQLVEIDPEAASLLLVEHFATDSRQYAQMVNELSQYPVLQYQLLRGIVKHHVTGEGGARWENILQDFQMGQELTETYVRLLCEHDPKEVYPYLMKAVDYRHEYCLKLVKKYKIEDATMYLLERTGDLTGAMDILLKALDERILVLQEAYGQLKTFDSDGLTMEEEKAVLEIVNVAVGLCQRNSSSKSEEDRHSELWFQVFDRIVAPAVQQQETRARSKQPKSRDVAVAMRKKRDRVATPEQKLKQTMNFLMREVLRHMMSHVDLTAILDKIVRDHARSEFGEFKDVIYNMLDTFQYESSILALANHALEHDMYQATAVLRRHTVMAYNPAESNCRLCHQSFLGKTSGVLVYRCGHGFHRTCLTEVSKCVVCTTSSKKPGKDGGPKADAGDDDKQPAKGGGGRGASMQEKAESVPQVSDVQSQARVFIARFEKHLRTVEEEEVPRFDMLQLFGRGVPDIYQYSKAKLQLAPVFETDVKVGSMREPGALPGISLYSNELRPEDAKLLTGTSSSGQVVQKKKGVGRK